MNKIVECVANFSEGREPRVILSIVNVIERVPGATVLGYESDADHNRSVVTFVGAPDVIGDAAFAGIRQAVGTIDMERHRGVHPRVGAADVVPFVPLRNISMTECVDLARELGERVGDRLNLPVYLYAHAAVQDENRNLADIRRGGYERLKATIPAGQPPRPDYGPRTIGKAGACIVGARDLLIAFNVFLNTSDVAIARAIARAIRESSGGLPQVKALGLYVRGRAQVSMNLTDYRVTSMRAAFDAIRRVAARYGVNIESSEIIGLVPRNALSDSDAKSMRIQNYGPERILETCLKNFTGKL